LGNPATRVSFIVNTQDLRYDLIGNMFDDSEKIYVYDEKGQLLSVTRKSDGQVLIECEYDALSRRIKKTSHVPSNKETRYIYDGQSFRVLAEVDSSGNTEKRFVWGVDLSGRDKDNLGGTGGALFMQDVQSNTYYAYGYDDLGNVVALYDLNNSNAAAATYSYSAYGKIIAQSGSMADGNPYRFSTRYYDPETELLYYGYRYYHPGWGRWITPDPIGERGGINLYGFTHNSPTNAIDILGLASKTKTLQCVSKDWDLGGKKLVWSLGPVWAEAGYEIKGAIEICSVCCDDNSKVTDYEGKLSATGFLKVSAVSYGGMLDTPVVRIEAWLGIKGTIFANISGSVGIKSNMCGGQIAKGTLCFSGSSGATLQVGGAFSYEIKIWPWEDVKGSGGAYGELTGQFTLKRCAEVTMPSGSLKFQWLPAEICADASASVKIPLPFGLGFTWTFWKAESCYNL